MCSPKPIKGKITIDKKFTDLYEKDFVYLISWFYPEVGHSFDIWYDTYNETVYVRAGDGARDVIFLSLKDIDNNCSPPLRDAKILLNTRI